MQEARKRSYTLHNGKTNVFLSKQEGKFKLNLLFIYKYLLKKFHFILYILLILYF